MRTLVVAVCLAVLVGSAGAAGAEIVRAFGAATSGPRGAVLTIDAAGPLFTLRGVGAGDRAERCVTVRNTGDTAVPLGLFGSGEDGGLARGIALVVRRGCDGAGDVLFEGSLRDYPAEAAPVIDPLPLAPGAGRSYSLAVRVGDGARGRASQAFAFGAAATQPPPGAAGAHATAASASADPCTAVAIRAGGRTLVKRVRVSRHVAAKLVVRVDRSGRRIALTTGLRVRDKTLVLTRWAEVAYAVDGRRIAVLRRRPFRARTVAQALRPGLRVVSARIVPRRGRTITARFTLTVPTGAPRGACAIG